MKKAKTDMIPLKVIQNIEFGILKYIRDVCDANGLRYYLAYGTLIGAVRHQGFVPWDDDMDIHMPRPDYIKFVKIVQQNPHPYYKLVSMETEPKFTEILSKMIDSRTKLNQTIGVIEKVQLGLYVDIFVLDGAGNTPAEAESAYYEALSCYRQWQKAIFKMFYPSKRKSESLRLWLRHIPAKILGVHYFLRKHTGICLQKEYDQCAYVGAMVAGTQEAERNVWRRDWFGDGTNVIFNSEVFRAPSNYDAVLRPEYGNYMQLPSPEKRVPHHSFTLSIPDKQLVEKMKNNNR